MSKNNNVNPDYYKTKGRERTGQDVATEVMKQNYAESKARETRRDSKAKDRKIKKKVGRPPG